MQRSPGSHLSSRSPPVRAAGRAHHRIGGDVRSLRNRRHRHDRNQCRHAAGRSGGTACLGTRSVAGGNLHAACIGAMTCILFRVARTAIGLAARRAHCGSVAGLVRRQCSAAAHAGVRRAARFRSTQRQLVGVPPTHRAESKPRTGQAAKAPGKLTASRANRKNSTAAPAYQFAARLTPSRKGETEIYTLASWADQDVFVKELDGALEAIRQRFADLIPRPSISSRYGQYDFPLAKFEFYGGGARASWTRTTMSSFWS